ncbi:porin family protein [Thiohalomonas denitrificans]|uniref:porin family protein n=1 Tax=Thiohalomonas denitrificans TaxID=415747 RepID=UPI0026F19B34|nr:porin family protein [Thiohalomonas denitrificans]
MVKMKCIPAMLGMSLIGMTPAVHAFDGGDLYFGADLLNTSYEVDSDYTSAAASATGFRFFAGFEFNEKVSVEAAWVDQGEGEDSYTIGNPPYDEPWHESMSLEGLQLSVLGRMPLQHEKLNLFGRVGLYMWDASYEDVDEVGDYVWASADESGTDLFLGFGLDYRISETISIRGAYDIITAQFDDGDLYADAVSVGFTFRP